MPPRRAGRPPEILLQVHFAKPPKEVRSMILDRLVDGARRAGLRLDARPNGGLAQSGAEYGRVSRWAAGHGLQLETHPAAWGDRSPKVRLRIEVARALRGSRLRVEVLGWSNALGSPDGGLADWAGGSLLPAFLRELAPAALGDWITDRKARRPTGAVARGVYKDPTYHWPNFLLILDRIRLTPEDRLLEVACGGGAFLRKALESGCTGVGVDHSPDMLRVAREANALAIAAGRVKILEAEADDLPVPDSTFTWCVCTGAFGFFPDPIAALQEMRRSLVPGGRVVIYTSPAKLRGTPAAPEPMASRLHFYSAKELRNLAKTAGFSHARVEPANEEEYARRAGLPDQVIALFHRVGPANLLMARRPGRAIRRNPAARAKAIRARRRS